MGYGQRALVMSRRTLRSGPATSPFTVMATAVDSEDTAVETPVAESADPAPAADAPSNKLYVGNLPFTVDSVALGDAFGDFGNVQSASVIYDNASGRSKGYGFVTFSTVDEAKSAQAELDGAEFGGRTIRVSFPIAKPRGTEREPRRSDGGRERRSSSGDRAPRETPGSKLYVGNLAWSMDDTTLEELFREFGEVNSAKVVSDETGRSKGFGFVSFNTPREAEEAIAQLNGQSIDGRNIRVNFAADKPKPTTSGRW